MEGVQPIVQSCSRCAVVQTLFITQYPQNPGNAQIRGHFVTLLLFKAEGGANQNIFQPIAHGIHQVVEIVNGLIDLVPKFIFIPSIV